MSANGTSADDDREAAVILLSMALVEIRYLAGSMRAEQIVDHVTTTEHE